VWNLKSGACLQVLRHHDHVVECLAFSNAAADQTLLALAAGASPAGAADAAEQKSSDGAVSPSASASGARSPGGSGGAGGLHLATGSRDKSIRIVRVDSGAVVLTLSGHDNWVRSLLFHPGGRYLLSCSDDRSVRVWDLARAGRPARRLDAAHETFVTAIDWASGAGLPALASVGVDAALRIWECK
jgi:platelet-activating factor acetylhydrolase IB subunit alpha